MKKALLFTLAVAVLSFSGSCVKPDNGPKTLTQTITATIKQNQTYTLVLRQNISGASFNITGQASHSLNSNVSVDATGSQVYQYTPATDFMGTDNVVISNLEDNNHQDNHKGCCQHSGKCGKGNDHDADDAPGMIVKINLNIEANK